MKRPFFWILCFLVAGILGAKYFHTTTEYVLFAALIFLAAYCLAVHFRIKEPFFFPLFALIGFLLLQFHLAVKIPEIEKWAEQEKNISITGQIIEISSTAIGNQKLEIETEEWSLEDQNIQVKLKLIVYPKESQELDYHDRIVIKGKLTKFSEKRNPGGFDEKEYYETKGFSYRVTAEEIQKIGEGELTFGGKIRDFRNKINFVFQKVLPEKESGIVKALVTGVKSDLEKESKELYKNAGISHILAISGLHVSIITLMIFAFLRDYVQCSKKLCSVISIIFILFYLVFSGASVSTIRAVIICVILLFGNLIDRCEDAFNSICIAAVGILLYQPRYLWNAGFQLSFITVTGLCFGSAMIKEADSIPELIKKFFGGSFLASIFSYPLVAYHFGSIPMWGFLVNLFVLPLIGVLVGFSMLVGMIGLISLKCATFFSGIIYLILCFYEMVCEFSVKLPFSQWNIGQLPLILLAGYYLLLTLICFYQENKKWMKVLMPCVLLFLSFGIVSIKWNQNIEIAFLDVGQGDSAVIHTYDGGTFLIDGGGNGFLEEGDNTGKRIVIPYLKSRGVNLVDAIFITHMDADHALGAIEVMETFSVNQVIISDCDLGESQLIQRFLDAAKEKKIPVTKIHKGKYLELENGLMFTCLSPSAETEMAGGNENSLVLKLSYKEMDFLFTGDIGEEEERKLLEEGQDIQADILKVAHHGSKYSSSEMFLEAVSCSEAIISSGKNNTYGHPAPETIENLEKHNINWYNTAENGALILKTDGIGYTIKPMIEGKKNEGLK